MALLGILNSTEHLTAMSEMVNDIQEKTGEAMVNKSIKSSSQPPVLIQPAHSNGVHGNKNTHGKSEEVNSQEDTVVFRFRNYILGTESSTEVPENPSEIQAIQSLEKCPVIKPEKEVEKDKQKKTPSHSQLETKDSFNETKTDVVIANQRDNVKEESGDVATEENGTPVYNTVDMEECTEALTEAIETNYSEEACINICVAEMAKKDHSIRAAEEGSNLHLKETAALLETLSEGRTKVSSHAEMDKKVRRAKKRQRKKKKTVVQPENDFKPLSLIRAENHTDSVRNIQLVSQEDPRTVIFGGQPDNNVDYKQQLSPGGEHNPSLSSSSPSETDHLTFLACSSASRQVLLQGPHQSHNQKHTKVPCVKNQCSEKSPQQGQCRDAEVINSQNIPLTCVQTTFISPSASVDKSSDGQTQNTIVTAGAVMPAQEDQSLLLSSRNCVGEDGVEHALEEASVMVAALPLTTPTIPEVIEREGERESVRRDSLERVDTVAIRESEKAVGKQDFGGIDSPISYVDRKKGLLYSCPQLSLIHSQRKCTLAFSATEGQYDYEEDCSSKMPHNSVETEMKGQNETKACSANREVSSAEGQIGEKEPLPGDAFINTSPHGLLTDSDCLDHSAVGLEAAGEGGEEVEKRGGLARDHGLFSQPEGCASGLSSAETELCPPTNVAESPLKPRCRTELISTITESLCTEEDCFSQPWQEQHAAPILPLSTNGNTEGGTRVDLTSNLMSEETASLGQTCEPSTIETEKNYRQIFLQPPNTSQQMPAKQQVSSIQQVQFESSTAESPSEFQAQPKNGCPPMSGGGLYAYTNTGRKSRVHFEDMKGMEMLAMDYASLPPLTVHESLHHPIVEASYIFPDFLSLNKPDIARNRVPTKNEPAIQKDVQLDKTEMRIKDDNKLLNEDQSKLETDTMELQLITETCSKIVKSPIKDNQNDNEGCLVLSHCDISEADCQTGKNMSAKVTNQLDGVIEGTVNLSLLNTKEIDNVHVKTKPSLKSEVNEATVNFEEKECNDHLPSLRSVLPADSVSRNDVFSEIRDVQVSAELETSSKPETVTSTASPQTTQSDTRCQSPSQLEETPLGLGTIDLLKTTVDSTILKEGEPTSVVSTFNQSVPVIELCASDPISVLQPPSPMLNHLDLITDCNSSPPEKTENHSADSCSSEVHGEKSTEITLMSLTKDMKHHEISVISNETWPNGENKNHAVEFDILVDNSLIDNLNVQFSQVENHVPGVVSVLAETGSDIVISHSPAERLITGNKPVACEASSKDDLINVSCPLSSDMPTNESLCEIKGESIQDEQKIDQTYVALEKEKKEVEESTMDNQKETVDSYRLQTGKTGATTQQSNGIVKEAVEGISVQNAESLLSNVKEGEKGSDVASEIQRKTSSLSPDKYSGPPENIRGAPVESDGEAQTAYAKGLCQTLITTLECNSGSDIVQSPALGQSQSITDPNSLSQQQDQQQCLESIQQSEESSGGCRVGQTQRLDSGMKVEAEEISSCVGNLCQSGSRRAFTGDDGNDNETLIEVVEGRQAVPGVGRVYLFSLPPSDTTESGTNAEGSATGDIGIERSYTHVGGTKQGMDENETSGLWVNRPAVDVLPDTEPLNDLGGKGQQNNNLPGACQDQHGTPSMPNSTELSVCASQEHETSPFSISVTSEVSMDTDVIHTEVFPRANQDDGIHRQTSSFLPEPVRQQGTVEDDSIPVKSNSSETKECEIQHTVCESLERQGFSVTSATQSCPGAQPPLEAAFDKEEAFSLGTSQNDTSVIRNEEMKTREIINLIRSAGDSSVGAVKVSDFYDSVETHHSSETTEGSTGPFETSENDIDITKKISGVIVVPSVLPKRRESLALGPPGAPTQSEKVPGQSSLSKPEDDVEIDQTVAASEEKPLHKAPLCKSPVGQHSVDTEIVDILASELKDQEPSTSWIKRLREAASCLYSNQDNPMNTSR